MDISKLLALQNTANIDTVEEAEARVLGLVDFMAEQNIACSLIELNRRYGGIIKKRLGVSLRELVLTLCNKFLLDIHLSHGRTWLISQNVMSKVFENETPENIYLERPNLIKLWVHNGVEQAGGPKGRSRAAAKTTPLPSFSENTVFQEETLDEMLARLQEQARAEQQSSES